MVMQGTLPQNRMFLDICWMSPDPSDVQIKSKAAVQLLGRNECFESSYEMLHHIFRVFFSFQYQSHIICSEFIFYYCF